MLVKFLLLGQSLTLFQAMSDMFSIERIFEVTSPVSYMLILSNGSDCVSLAKRFPNRKNKTTKVVLFMVFDTAEHYFVEVPHSCEGFISAAAGVT